ncbi:inositol monophosphatase 3-like [Acanthaster planci]|uniref:inositol-phosphate phosphatase n=1 Tax=Acanthaster planci TaxID=133434 RepID=A0A8B7Y8V7_ACAPL|nr:inositol monophosphatase 3-like [Acanthaster planci]
MASANMASVRISPIGFVVIFLLAGAVILYVQRSWNGKEEREAKIVRPGQTVSLRQLLSAGIDAAERGGLEVKKVMEEQKLNEKSKGETREGANNPVTDGDMRSHKAMVHSLKKTFPLLKIVSEEKEVGSWDDSKLLLLETKRSDVVTMVQEDEMVPFDDITVWIDPLDATQEYTEKLLEYVTTMVCVAVRGVPTIGIIHKPFKTNDKTVWAYVGKTHSPNLKLPIKKAAEELTTSPKIIVSRSHQGAVESVAKKSFGEKTEVIPAGGAGYKVWSLFEGKADAYIHTTLIKKWDICAGNALLNEAKGRMTTLKGDGIDYHWNPTSPNPKNEGGLLATLWEHEMFLERLKPVVDAKQR